MTSLAGAHWNPYGIHSKSNTIPIDSIRIHMESVGNPRGIHMKTTGSPLYSMIHITSVGNQIQSI